jgi:quercetin dioxygenase-like cupin family protein
MVQIPVEFKNETIFNKLPVLLYAGQISDEPDWKFPSHKHDDLSEIIYISEGEGEFIIGNKL